MALRLQALTPVTCTLANTAYQLTATGGLYSASITIQADSANVGIVTVAGSEVTASNGTQLIPGQSAVIEYPSNTRMHDLFDPSTIYVSSTTAGDKVRVSLMRGTP